MPINPLATSCSRPSRLLHNYALQGFTDYILSYLLFLKQLGGIKSEELQGHLRYEVDKGQGASSTAGPLSIKTTPSFTLRPCFVPSQLTPWRINLQHRRLALTSLEAIGAIHLVRPGSIFNSTVTGPTRYAELPHRHRQGKQRGPCRPVTIFRGWIPTSTRGDVEHPQPTNTGYFKEEIPSWNCLVVEEKIIH